MGRLREWVQEHFEPKDIPIAFVVHEVISLTFAGFTWGCCYYLQPSKALVESPIAQALPDRTKQSIKWQFERARGPANRMVARVPRVGQGSRLAVSLAESTTLRAFLKPVTVGGKLVATWQVSEVNDTHQ